MADTIGRSAPQPAEGDDSLPKPNPGSPTEAKAGKPGDKPAPLDSPGTSGGTAGTGGDNKVQDDLDR